MVSQYPDIINIVWKGQPYQDSEGKWVQPMTETFFSGKCRAVAATADRRNKSQSGMSIKYQYTVFMPKTTTIIPEGAKVEITRHDGLQIEGTAKNPINNQLNSVLWL